MYEQNTTKWNMQIQIIFLKNYHFNYIKAYNTIREVLFENIFNLHVHINEPLTLDFLIFGNPNLDINMTKEAISVSVHEYIKLSKKI